MRQKRARAASQAVIRAVIYARYSSTAQNDASIEQQVEMATAYAAQNGYTVTAVYADHGKSGRSDKRPEFQRMMRDAAAGRFDCVIAWKTNRMGRNMLEAMLNDATLTRSGVRCLYVKEDYDDTPAGRYALRSMMNLNQFFSENMAEDIERGMMDNAAQCKVNGKIAYGYCKGPDSRYALDPLKAPIVREIFDRLDAGEAEVDIYSSLNSRSIPSPSGGVWNKNSLHSIAANIRYTGVYVYRDVKIPGGVPAIVSKEVFDRVQDKRKIRKAVKGRHSPNGDYLLTGKLHCGHCDAHMVGMSGVSKSGSAHFYYSCQSRRNRRDCKKENVRRDWIEQMVAEIVQQHILQPEVMEWIADAVMQMQECCKNDTDLAIYQQRLAEINASISNVLKAIEMGIITETTKARLLELEKERGEYERKIEAENAIIPNVTRNEVIFWLERFRNGDVKDRAYQKELIDAFIVKVYLYDDKMKIIFDHSGDKNSVSTPLTLDELNSVEVEDCSTKLSVGVPLEAQANIFCIKNVFVCVFYFDKTES